MWRRFNPFQSALFRNFRKQYTTKRIRINEREFEIRQLNAGDIKNLLDVQRKVYEGETPWVRSAFLSELYSRHAHLYLGVLEENQMIGFMGVRVSLSDGHITNIAVLPQFQGLGIGTILLEESEKFSRSLDCATMSLEVRRSNQDAQRLYRRFGYVSRKVLPQYYDENQEDAIDMVKYL
ncbi:ribosomal protein S18-alanine N-acetyltransferase [Enterococcus alcedinis]|uniref:Ribosomal-protein-alanine acetyltransferase n=1 Tax=Enterococcus alcedinis TaxID=1274384 RepID=A0A917JFW6_9ENTE|nr:ribosomal protein S18-alanine N-acetyltransferase [Enterococcus alcedinis]MBP2102500.1 ribosomal-protein-alanine N-acetyltransferase [Enterococcus alcedinis]GGI65964.1 ribosomal-protein-alanine acetyltransferase [Enterococcus alcedinis]